MAKKSGLFEDLIEIASRLPWWLSLVLALVSYFGLHHIAMMEVEAPKAMQDMGKTMTGQMITTFAMFGQYILPAAFSFGAIISGIGQRKRVNIYQSVAGQSGKGALNGISWREFEMLVGQWFRHQGYVVTETGGVADGGIDLVLNRDGETYLVQCKQWKAFKVGVNIVRELLGVMAARGAGGGFIVTSGVFTQEAKRFASDCNIKLIYGSQLSDLIQGAKREKARELPSRPVANVQSTIPTCPKCGSGMVIRKASKGPQVGQSFWGCSKYPNCRGTRPV